jgi:hypothetical protein
MGVSGAFSFMTPAIALVLSAGVAGCVESFPGSNVQIDFSGGVPAAALPGVTPVGLQPPSGTHYSLYATREERDESGEIVRNDQFHVEDFEIVRLINRSSPCFIDLEGSRYPGIHATRYLERLQADTGIADPLNPPPECCVEEMTPLGCVEPMDPPSPRGCVSAGDRIDVVTARQRMIFQPQFEGSVKAVVSVSQTFQYGPVAADCNGDGSLIPPPECTDDAQNRLRLAACQREWRRDTGFYEGSDKVFSLPLNGTFYGVVTGPNPINGGTIRSSSIFVDEALGDVQGFTIRWQYKDANGDGTPDVPGGGDPGLGTLMMSGRIQTITRGVLNANLANAEDPTISARMAVFHDLASDDVEF